MPCRRFYTLLKGAAFVVLTAATGAQAQTADLDAAHWGYDFLDLLAARGMLGGIYTGSEPLQRGNFSELLDAAQKAYRNDTSLLSHAEAILLEKLRGELGSDSGNAPEGVEDRFRERHLFTWSEGNSWFAWDAIASQELNLGYQDSTGGENDVSRTTAGSRIRGYLSETLHFYLSFKNTLERGGEAALSNFDPSQGLPAVAYDENLYRDDAIAYLRYRAPWFDMTLGRQRIRWGPGWRGGLTLSANNPPMNGLRLDVRYTRLAFASFFGELDGGAGDRQIAAHRLDVKLGDRLRVGAGEVVIYAGRGTELLYAIPIMPLHIAEHHLGDKDNNAMTLDFRYDALRGGLVYGELFLDDYKLRKSPFRHWGNKWGALLGGYMTRPFGLENTGFRMEYSRIEPYVYTAAPWNPGLEYQNYDRSIGHWLKPDSDEIYMRLEYTPHWRTRLALSWSGVRRGALSGGVNIPAEGEEKEFLSGTVERKTTWTFGITGEIFTEQYIRMEIQRVTWDNYDMQVDRTEGDGRLYIFWSIDY